jgi:heavy metal efflux system protein
LLKEVTHEDPWLPRKLLSLYQPALLWCLDNSKKIFFIAGGLLVVTALVFTRIGSTFMPTMDEGDIIVQLEKLPSITLEQSVALDGQVQKNLLKNVPETERPMADANQRRIDSSHSQSDGRNTGHRFQIYPTH